MSTALPQGPTVGTAFIPLLSRLLSPARSERRNILQLSDEKTSGVSWFGIGERESDGERGQAELTSSM
ncbi:hypothetical protein DPEC_G00125350 [Dallia pectoralis]|uniref:Uncharacterized protein n=1 Tax=Dallia pectoralis TaxID=75939 RepID=A0ACC2GR61_DALPE|nr:hypothetical protein DPEC_G00125350 [Dallia pectoralis]